MTGYGMPWCIARNSSEDPIRHYTEGKSLRPFLWGTYFLSQGMQVQETSAPSFYYLDYVSGRQYKIAFGQMKPRTR
jgi:hypothetical protein